MACLQATAREMASGYQVRCLWRVLPRLLLHNYQWQMASSYHMQSVGRVLMGGGNLRQIDIAGASGRVCHYFPTR